jgi:hypothetical protein
MRIWLASAKIDEVCMARQGVDHGSDPPGERPVDLAKLAVDGSCTQACIDIFSGVVVGDR